MSCRSRSTGSGVSSRGDAAADVSSRGDAAADVSSRGEAACATRISNRYTTIDTASAEYGEDRLGFNNTKEDGFRYYTSPAQARRSLADDVRTELPDFAAAAGGVPLIVPAGSVVVMHYDLLHRGDAAAPNVSRTTRRLRGISTRRPAAVPRPASPLRRQPGPPDGSIPAHVEVSVRQEPGTGTARAPGRHRRLLGRIRENRRARGAAAGVGGRLALPPRI